MKDLGFYLARPIEHEEAMPGITLPARVSGGACLLVVFGGGVGSMAVHLNQAPLESSQTKGKILKAF